MAGYRIIIFLGMTWFLAVNLEAASKYYTGENKPYEFGFTVNDDEQKQQTQHRHEKKDENGIIMGEFGFLTADGVYHVTVYATDENGNFKILSMKNLRIKPFPTAGETKSPQAKSIPFPKSPVHGNTISQAPQKRPEVTPQVSQNRPSLRPIPVAAPIQSCSSCSIPTSPKPQLTDLAVVSRDDQFPPYPEKSNNPRARQFVPSDNPLQHYGQKEEDLGQGEGNFGQIQKKFGQSQQNFGQDQQSFGRSNLGQGQQPFVQGQANFGQGQQNSGRGQQNFSQDENYFGHSNLGQQNDGQRKQNFGQEQKNFRQDQNVPSTQAQDGFGSGPSELQLNHNTGQFNKKPDQFGQSVQPENAGSVRESGQRHGQGIMDTNSGQQEFEQQLGYFGQRQGQTGEFSGPNVPNYRESGQPMLSPGSKPKLISAQMQVVDKNTDVNKLNPGEKVGLPTGLKKGNMLQLLYTFNYTVGFHAHHEEGYANGVKIGYYYVTGRNGVRTRIDYVADSDGFHPKISTEVLDLLSEDVPKPETEKEEKYGLKGYEFKWLYFPPNSR